jgi:regulator of sigma E protease
MRFFNANVVAFKQIFTGRRSARDSLAGPIGMAKLTSGVFKDGGWAGVIQMMGFLSLSLGVMNLLPIPVLDGGMILMIFIEGLLGLIGKTVSMAMRERYQQVGFVALMLLMGFVFFNDFARDWPFGKSSEPAPAVQASPASGK